LVRLDTRDGFHAVEHVQNPVRDGTNIEGGEPVAAAGL
jgi:hypothetical protein